MVVAFASPDPRDHLRAMAGVLSGWANMQRGEGTRLAPDTPDERRLIYSALLGAESDQATAEAQLASLSEDGLVQAAVGDNRRSRHRNSKKVILWTLRLAWMLRKAEQLLVVGQEAHAWGWIAEAKSVLGHLEVLLSVAREQGDASLVSQLTSKGARAANAARAESTAPIKQFVLEQWDSVPLDSRGRKRQTKAQFAIHCVAKVKEKFDAEISRRTIEEDWLPKTGRRH